MSRYDDDIVQNLYGPKLEAVEGADLETLKRGIKEGDDTFLDGVMDEQNIGGRQHPSAWNLKAVGPRERAIRRLHEDRSSRAQDMDERQHAPVTTSEEQWMEAPHRYDYPGVDTIPEERQARRAEYAAGRILEEGYADRVEQKGTAKYNQGKFSPRGSSTYGQGYAVARVQGTADQPERTLAHELGHAIDYGTPKPDGDALQNIGGSRYGLQKRLFDVDDPEMRKTLEEEALELGRQARGGFSRSSPKHQRYRREHGELTADAVGQAILQPRATKRDAPNLFRRLETELEGQGLGDIIPDPLGRDPGRQGILKT